MKINFSRPLAFKMSTSLAFNNGFLAGAKFLPKFMYIWLEVEQLIIDTQQVDGCENEKVQLARIKKELEDFINDLRNFTIRELKTFKEDLFQYEYKLHLVKEKVTLVEKNLLPIDHVLAEKIDKIML